MNCGLAVVVIICCVAMVISSTTTRNTTESPNTPSTTTESPIHLPCTTDADCSAVVCTNPREVPECHPTFFLLFFGAECHCHIPDECAADADCVQECGQNARCDKGACHGDCVHV